MIVTRKIELLIAEDDKDKRRDIWNYLRSLEMDTFRAANLIVCYQYFNDTFKDCLKQVIRMKTNMVPQTR